jgi:hypothetical protein
MKIYDIREKKGLGPTNIACQNCELVHGTCVYKFLALVLEPVKHLVNQNDGIAITPTATTDHLIIQVLKFP